MTNQYRWQVPGNANFFDTSIENWKDSTKYVSKRSIGVLHYLQEKVVIKKDVYSKEIKDYLNVNFDCPNNNSCKTDWYRPLEFLGLINRFDIKSKKDSTLSLSIDGKIFYRILKMKIMMKQKNFYYYKCLE